MFFVALTLDSALSPRISELSLSEVWTHQNRVGRYDCFMGGFKLKYGVAGLCNRMAEIVTQCSIEARISAGIWKQMTSTGACFAV
jgi:hypothetical protein